MKCFYLFIFTLLIGACSGLQPYKNQNLDYLKDLEQRPAEYQGKVVSFGGEVKGITEDTQHLRLVLKTDVPFYYYATGKGNSLSYELLLVEYIKPLPSMSGIAKGNTVKVLARVGTYEKRKNRLGIQIGVLHLNAFALTDRPQKKDLFYTSSPEVQLYESWKTGRLFYQDSAEQISALYKEPVAPQKAPAKKAKDKPPVVAREIVYDEVEDFIIP